MMADLRDYWEATRNAIADRSLKSFRETLQYSEPGFRFPDADHIRKQNEERAITDEAILASRKGWIERTQDWIEDRPVIRQISKDLEEMERASKTAATSGIGREAESQGAASFQQYVKDVNAPDGDMVQAWEAHQKRMGVQPDSELRKADTEEQRAAQSWRKDAGESYMAELANGSESNVDRRQMEMWATKQEQNRAAWAVASPVNHERQQETQANTLTLKP